MVNDLKSVDLLEIANLPTNSTGQYDIEDFSKFPEIIDGELVNTLEELEYDDEKTNDNNSEKQE